jgi:hypothetical protein
MSLRLEVFRYPLLEMEQGDEPEIAERHRAGLVHWVLKRCYETRDMEGSAPQRAALHEAEFEKLFGIRDNAETMRKRRRHRAPVVRPQRF